MKEEISSELGTPKSLREAYYGKGPFHKEVERQENISQINPEVASKAAFDLYEKLLGGEGYVGGAATAPLRAAGIETKPQNIQEETARLTSEFLALFLKGGMPFDQASKMALTSATAYVSGRGLGLEETPATILAGTAPFAGPKIVEGVGKAARTVFPALKPLKQKP